jgi:hypothetical protein
VSRRQSLVSVWLLLATATSCGSTASPPPDEELAVLFVGNSLTAINNLPGMVAALAEAAGVEFRYREVTVGGAGLEDHWNNGRAIAALEEDQWDIVVLQQGPSSLPSSRVNLIEWTGRFAGRIRELGARPAIYMVWPPLGGDWDAVTRNYTDAAIAVDGLLLPAGEALRAIHRDLPSVPVFSSDQFHPSPEGSFLAALVIVGGLTGRSTEGLSDDVSVLQLPPGVATALERAADGANRDFGLD